MTTENWPRADGAQDGRLQVSLAAVGGVVLLVAIVNAIVAGVAGPSSLALPAAGVDTRDTALVRDVGRLPDSVTPADAAMLAQETCAVLDTGASGDVIIPWLQDKGFDVENATRLLAWSVTSLCPDARVDAGTAAMRPR